MSYSQFVNDLKELKIKKKGKKPKVNPSKFYPSQSELQAAELLGEELSDYAQKMAAAARTGKVKAVYDTPGAVPDSFRSKAAMIAADVNKFNVLAFANYSELVVGERFFVSSDKKNEILSNWTENFVNLCKSTNEEMRKKVAGVVSDGVLSGRNLRETVLEVQHTCSDFSRSKAELIATTEVGKLNSAIARNQSESAGIEYYEWSAAMDGRTRESHAVMDGRICKWGDDEGFYEWEEQQDGKRKLVRRNRPGNAYKGAPGTDFRCRCVALPYVPEYEDDYEREEGPVQGVVQERPEATPPSEELLEMQRKLDILTAANRRHDARSEEQKERIQKEMEERLRLRKEARDLISELSGIYGVDTDKLKNAVESASSERITEEMKPLQQAKAEIGGWGDLIDDPMGAARTYGFSRAKNAREAAIKTMDKWKNLSLEEQKDKLEFEISHVEKAKKYATWELSAQIYRKQLRKVEADIEWKKLDDRTKVLDDFAKNLPKKNAAFTKLLKEVEKAAKGDHLNASDVDRYTKAIEAAEKKMSELDGSIILPDIDATEMEKMFDDFNNKTPNSDSVDTQLRKDTKALWATLTDEDKIALTRYTQHYEYLNKRLRGIPYNGLASMAEFNKDMPLLQKALAKHKEKKNIVVGRFVDDFKVKEWGRNLSTARPGDIFVEKGFFSTAVKKEKGLSGDIEMIIAVPKGAQGVYAEPFSHYTDSSKFNGDYYDVSKLWNGTSKESFGGEREWIGQRGSKLKVIKTARHHSTKASLTIYFQMIGQLA